MSPVTLRLFHETDPFRQLEARTLAGGELTVGRDESASWVLDDPDRAVSRRHCILSLSEQGLMLRDVSANGTFLGRARLRAPADAPTRIEPGETLRLGPYLIVVDAEAPEGAQRTGGDGAFDAPFAHPLLRPVAVDDTSLSVPSEWPGPVWPEAAKPAPAHTTGSLLEAFCAGAKLDSSAFSGEDPHEVMRRLGGLYQQMVLGLYDLMDERTSIKAGYRMDRTTVRAEGNNPFKWARPQRLAVDLLKDRNDGFLTGQAAVKSSFEDMKKHLLCLLAGMRGALIAALEGLSPAEVEERIKGETGLLKNKAALAWNEYGRTYALFLAQAHDDPDSPMNREFRAAYERQLKALDGGGGPA
jgi:predicted component of type VI protein secretion system